MKTFFAFFIFLTFFNNLFSQHLAPMVFSVCGNSVSKNHFSLDYVIGQTAGNVSKQNNFHLTNGFLQPTEKNFQIIRNFETKITVFPNPASDELNVIFKDSASENSYFVEIFDIMGKKFSVDSQISQYSTNILIKLIIKELETGQYFIRITSQKNRSFSFGFKILKM